MRGLTKGKVQVADGDGLEQCIVMGASFPSWLPFLEEMGYGSVLVFLDNDSNLKLAEACVRDDCMILVGENWSVFSARLPRFSVSLTGFVDGRLNGTLSEIALSMNVTRMVCTKGLRRNLMGWNATTAHVQHESLGGVTTDATTLVCLQAGGLSPMTQALEGHVQRDASTVLSIMPYSKVFRTAPADQVIIPLQLQTMEATSNPKHVIYHGGGLLPSSLDKRVRVCTPGLYCPKGKWVVCQLTLEEVLLSKDYSTKTASIFARIGVTNGLLRALIPGKCLTIIKDLWGVYGGVLPSY